MTHPRETLRRSLDDNRAELDAAVERLRGAVRREVPLAGRIRANPAPWLAGGLVLGLVCGLLTRWDR